MAGLTIAGFEPEQYENIKARIEGKLENFSPGFDFSPDSPDGQLIGVMTYEIFQLWSQLGMVHDSYDPQISTGAGLKNIGELSGISYGQANRSFATCETQGTSGTIIPQGSLVSDGTNEFYTAFEAVIPANIQVVAVVAGEIPVPSGSITTIVTQGIGGWTGITQTTDGTEGSLAQTEQQYRNTRTNTVMRNNIGIADALQARLIELGAVQAQVVNNDNTTVTLPDGTPPRTVHVTLGEITGITAADIGKTIYENLPLGTPTYGNQSVVHKDNQGHDHTINYSTATEVAIELEVDVTFLSDNTAGAIEAIQQSLINHINSLVPGQDVIWSRLFAYITPYSMAQVNALTIAKSGESQGTANISLTDSEFASLALADITFTET